MEDGYGIILEMSRDGRWMKYNMGDYMGRDGYGIIWNMGRDRDGFGLKCYMGREIWEWRKKK